MRKFKKGQVGLLIIIVVGVLVALIMSVASGTLNDVVLSRQTKEGGTAFHVAEQGVEEALNEIRANSNLNGGSYSGQVSFENLVGHYSVSHYRGLDIYVKEGEVVEVNLDGYSNNWLGVFWVKKNKFDEDINCQGEGSGRAPASLEITEVLKSGGTKKLYYNSAKSTCLNNGFSMAGTTTNEFTSRINLTGLSQVAKLRLKPIYNGSTVALTGPSLPPQIYIIHSAAGGEDVQKEIEVKRSANQAGSIFDFALFSAGTIIK